jgi:hypothetical protein
VSLTVLYITGWCRSGSTMLGNVLAEVPGIVHVGELRFLWLNGVLKRGSNSRCGCGRDLMECPLWGDVLDAVQRTDSETDSQTAYRSVSQTDFRSAFRTFRRAGRTRPADVADWQAACRTRHTWRTLRRPPRNGWPATLRAAYHAIAEITGARVVVDSSKYASDAALLTHLDGIRPAYVHLVRDPRAVACSWLRPKDYTGRRSALGSTLYWTGFNLAAEAVARARREESIRLRYEDLVREPRAAVDRILRHLGSPGPNPVAGDGTVELGGNHTVTGNPNRFARGRVAIEEDRRWHTGLAARHRLGATVLALPLLPRYGYSPRTADGHSPRTATR